MINPGKKKKEFLPTPKRCRKLLYGRAPYFEDLFTPSKGAERLRWRKIWSRSAVRWLVPLRNSMHVSGPSSNPITREPKAKHRGGTMYLQTLQEVCK